MISILIVDDEVMTTILFSKKLKRLGFKSVAIAHCGKDAIIETVKFKPDLVLMDICMDYETDGIDACKEIKVKSPKTKVIFVSAYPESTYKDQLTTLHYDGYYDKIIIENEFENILTRITG